MVGKARKATYKPKRKDIVFMDFEPVKGKEIGKYRPALILSSLEYYNAYGLVICCPISTSIREAMTEVPITVQGTPSVIVSNLVNTFSWKERKGKYVDKLDSKTYSQVLIRLIPLIGGEEYISNTAK